MSTSREQILAELQQAGIDRDKFEDYWVDCLVHFRNTGKCGSVNFSTVAFIPIISSLLGNIAKQP